MPKSETPPPAEVKKDPDKAESPEKKQAEKPKTPKEFDAKRRKALATLEKIHLDTKVTETNAAELELHEELEKYINELFEELEQSYQERLFYIGHGPDKPEVIAARREFDRRADRFILRMEIRILEENVNSNDEQGAKMAKIRLIDGFTKVRGFGRYLIEANPDLINDLLEQNPKSRHEFNKILKEALDDQRLLESGIKQMIKKVPKFRQVDEEGKIDEAADLKQTKREKDRFEKLIGNSLREAKQKKNPRLSLTDDIGFNHWKQLRDALARRFYVEFNEDGTPKHYVDLMNDNRVYKPGKEIDTALKVICRSASFRSAERLEEYNEKIDEKEEEQLEQFEELLHGLTWDFDDEEVTGLSTLKDNPQLNKLIESTDKYEKEVNKEFVEMQKQLAGLRKLEQSETLEKLQKRLTVDKVKATPALRKSGALAALLELIIALAGKGKRKEKTRELTEVSLGIARGENPAKQAEKNKEVYKEVFTEGTVVTDMFDAYLNPNGKAADKLFEKTEKDKKLSSDYRNLAGKPVIEDYLKKELDFTELLKIEKTGTNKYQFNILKKGKPRMYKIVIKDEKLEISGPNQTKTPQRNNLDGLKRGCAIKEEVDTARETYKKGQKLFDQNKPAEALKLFRKAEEIYPRYNPQYRIAQCLEQLGKPEEALKFYRKCLESDLTISESFQDEWEDAKNRVKELTEKLKKKTT